MPCPDQAVSSRPARLRPDFRLVWFLAGAAVAAMAMAGEALVMGSWAALVRVGTDNPAFSRLDTEIGPLPAVRRGHDGQIFYLIARDPLGTRGTPDDLSAFDRNGPRYRYGRILYPALAGGFGQFGASGALTGMIALSILGMGLAAAALADLSRQFGLGPKSVILALLNPGALVALFLLTADPLALGLALSAIALAVRGRWGWAVAACTLAGLTKETYLLVPLALAYWQLRHGNHRRAWAIAIVSLGPTVLWSSWLTYAGFETGAAAGNLGPPFAGVIEAVPVWTTVLRHEPFELVLGAVACLMLARGAALMCREGPVVLRWLVVPWVVLGAIATFQVWGAPNNAARVLAPLWTLNILLLGVRERALTERARQRRDGSRAAALAADATTETAAAR